MPRSPSGAALAAPIRDISKDRLDKVRNAVREVRDKLLRKAEIEDELKTLNVAIYQQKHETLPALFGEAGLTNLGLVAEGNLPAYECKKLPYYKANISSDWEPERRESAFAYLEQQNAGDLVKTQIVVILGRGDRAIAKQVETTLRELSVPFERELAVPWNSLTAWLRERIEKRKITPDLDLIGGEVGEIVEMKPVKQER